MVKLCKIPITVLYTEAEPHLYSFYINRHSGIYQKINGCGKNATAVFLRKYSTSVLIDPSRRSSDLCL